MVDGNNLLALTAATPLEEKLCVVTGKEPSPRTHVISDDVFGQQWVEKNGCSGVRVVVAKESDVTERMIHTGGEQIQGNETHNFRDRGLRIGEKGGGGGKLDSTSSLRLDKDPRWALEVRMCGYIAAGLLRADVLSGHRAPARFWTVGAKASHGNGRLLDACFRVFACCAKKKIFNSFTSFSCWKWFILRLLQEMRR